MSNTKQPKVILFDIGGVCVRSPFQVVLDYELSSGIPPGWINYSISKSAPHGFWHRLERGEILMDETFFNGFKADLHVQTNWDAFYQREQAKDARLPPKTPPLPIIDGKWLFNEMMLRSHSPDPWVLPALHNLKASGKYVLAALSNTFIFPPGHQLYSKDYFGDPLRRLFDVFVSSAHVGLRKPEPQVYQLALKRLNEYAQERGLGAIAAQDVLFLDDIGENLKEARNQGFRTIKVPLGRAYEAVDELEAITGLKLEGSHPKVAILPNYSKAKAKI